MENDRKDALVRKKHEQTRKVNLRVVVDNVGENYSSEDEKPRYMQVSGREYPCGSNMPPTPSSIPPYYFEGKLVKGSPGDHAEAVLVQISELADKELTLLMLDRIVTWIKLNRERLTEGEEALDSFNSEWVNDDADWFDDDDVNLDSFKSKCFKEWLDDDEEEDEIFRFVQVNGSEYARGFGDTPMPPSIPPYDFGGRFVKESWGGHSHPVRVRIRKFADMEIVLHMLERLGDRLQLNWERLTEGEEALDSFNSKWISAWSDWPGDDYEELSAFMDDDDDDHGRKCVYEVRDDGGGHDAYPDVTLVAIYADEDAAEEHAGQIGGYVRRVFE